MDYTRASDEDLALALQEGDEMAFDELVKRHQGHIYAVSYRVVLNREDALDVAQEVLVKAYTKIHKWRPTSGFVPWLMRLTVNQSIDVLRRRKRLGHVPLDEAFGLSDTADTLEPRTSDVFRGAHAAEVGVRIETALGVLSPSQRAVFAMRHYEGLQLAEIAQALGCTLGTVKVHLFRAVKKMQHELRDLMDDESPPATDEVDETRSSSDTTGLDGGD